MLNKKRKWKLRKLLYLIVGCILLMAILVSYLSFEAGYRAYRDKIERRDLICLDKAELYQALGISGPDVDGLINTSVLGIS